jgi:hypothetical protein
MGSSFTDFRGKGFWSRDSLLQAWLRVVALNMGEEVYKEGWQHDLRDHWLLMSGIGGGGCVWPSLDEFLTDEDQVAVILRASECAIQRLRAFGAFVPAAFLNALGFEYPFDADLPIEWFNRIADCLSALLRGTLATDASNSPTLPATRHGQPCDELEQPRKTYPASKTQSRRLL